MDAPARPPVERRRQRRLELSVPLVFTTKTRLGSTVSRSGVTQNVSPGGIYFRTQSAEDLGPQQEITVKLVVSRRGVPSEATVSLSGEARVLRVERLATTDQPPGGDGQWWGVAAQFVSRPRVDLSTVEDLFLPR